MRDSVSNSSASPSLCEIGLCPFKPLLRSSEGDIWAPDPAIISRFVNETQKILKIDFSAAGLVASGIIGNLDMTNIR